MILFQMASKLSIKIIRWGALNKAGFNGIGIDLSANIIYKIQSYGRQ